MLPKIRYYGHVGQQTGYGRAAEQTCMALLEVGVELEIRPLAPLPSLAFEGDNLSLVPHLKQDAELTRPDVVIVHTLPLDCQRVLKLAPTPGAEHVAYTTWEFHNAPEGVRQSLEGFHEVWVPSVASRLPLEKPPCRVIPHAFDHRTVPSRTRITTMDDGIYRFLYVGAWNHRKNVTGLVHAFAMAFEPTDNAELIIHAPGTMREIFMAAALSTGLDPNGKMPRMTFQSSHVPYSELLDLYRTADCYVTASRGEGWNLPLFDAMTCGCHVIAPSGHGSDDYILKACGSDAVHSFRQPASLDVQALRDERGGVTMQTRGVQGLTSRVTWGDPDLVQLANWMRRRYVTRAEQRYDIKRSLSEYGYKAVGELMLGHLTKLKEMS